MDRIALVVLLCVAACAPRRASSADGPRPDGPPVEPLRLCIRNSTLGYGNVIASAGPVRFTVLPGQEQCRNVNDTGPGLRLAAVTTGGGVQGPLSYATTLRSAATKCWVWNLTNTPSSSLDLEPCD